MKLGQSTLMLKSNFKGRLDMILWEMKPGAFAVFLPRYARNDKQSLSQQKGSFSHWYTQIIIE